MKTLEILKKDESLKRHCSLNIGGNAAFFAEPSTVEELRLLLLFSLKMKLPYLVIGNGTNLLFDDIDFDGLIIKIGSRFSSIQIQSENIITVQAGSWMPFVARFAQVNGLSGLEHTVGIPGNVGGVVVMNAGSQRQSIGERVVSVRVLNENNDIEDIEQKDCKFLHRKSIFQEKGYIVLSVSLQCEKNNPHTIRKRMHQILKERRHKFPLKEPNCGSVFKSDPDIYLKIGSPGKIIEDLGFKGERIGDISVSEKHANFFVNKGHGTAKDFMTLVRLIDEEVYCKHKVHMSREVQFISMI